MDKKSKEIIKEAIEYFLKVRFNANFNRVNKISNEKTKNINDLKSNDEFEYNKVSSIYHRQLEKKHFLSQYRENGLSVLEDGSEKYNRSFDEQLIKLNSLLDKKDQIKEIVDLEQQMKKIQAKKFITVKEFTEIYNISKTSQQNYRGRMHDPLPYHQKVAGGKIVYVVEEVEKWFENQHK